MPTHSMRWTALPDGLDAENRPRLSAHAAFRLQPDGAEGVLADFPQALDWPARALAFSVTFARGTTQVSYAAKLPATDSRRLDWWQALFRPDLHVRGVVFQDYTGWRLRSFAATRLATHLRTAYARLASDHAEDHPPVGDLPEFEVAGFWSRRRSVVLGDQSLVETMEATLAAQGYLPDPPPRGITPEQVVRRDFIAFRRFLDRFYAPDPADTGAEPGDRPGRVGWVTPPQFDFHEATSACAGHSSLLRPLGLVFDLVVAAETLQIESDLGGAPERVQVSGESVGDTAEAFDNVPSAWTICQWPPREFHAAAWPDGDYEGRYLNLGDPSRFHPVTVELGTGALKTMSLGGVLQSSDARRTRTTPTRQPAAALKAGGIAILRRGRAERFYKDVLKRAKQLNDLPKGEELLYLDDLVRGFRLDVFDSSSTWRSLMRRQGEIRLGNGNGVVIPVANDEASVGEVPVGDDTPDQVYLHEELLRWNGWSLAAPKPGASLSPEEQVTHHPTSDPLPDLPVVAEYHPQPGTLPTLRYGNLYRLRARTVDIAGNSEPPGTTADAAATRRVFFGRLDPVPSPDVLLTAPRKPGERALLVVLRSHRYNQPPLDTESVASRHLLPPRSSVEEMERHGVLDGPDGRPSPALYSLLAERDSFSLEQIGEIDPDDVTGGDEGASRYYAAMPFAPKYLPDVLARAIQILRPDGTPLLNETPEFAVSPWPDYRPLRLEIVEGSVVDANYNASTGLIQVRLPKAEVLRLRVSSRFAAEDFSRFGLAEWLGAHLGLGAPEPEMFAALRQMPPGEAAVMGRHWMFTPWRHLTLVHAVKQPLHPPAFVDLTHLRAEGWTIERLNFALQFSKPSTVRVDLLATWDEGIDEGPGSAPPRIENVETVAAHVPVDPVAHDADSGLDFVRGIRLEHEFGDTKHRAVQYRMEATSAFVEHFLEHKVVTVTNAEAPLSTEPLAPRTVILRSQPDAAGNITTYRRDDGDGGVYVVDALAGRVVFNAGPEGAIPDGTSIDASYATAPVTRSSAPLPYHDMPASTRPAAPAIRSVLPTFRWESEAITAGMSSKRLPAGVRVWLERPWWSSGLGEKLAVVLTTTTVEPSEAMQPFVTRWGRDPIHDVGPVQAHPTPDRFPLRALVTGNLSAPGAPQVVRAAAHEVAFDEERDLWYCDIDIDAGSYWPFVRLALARWQPHAVVAPGGSSVGPSAMQLSPVVLADIVQVAPGRFATVTVQRGPRQQRKIVIALDGTSYTGVGINLLPQVVAFLERRPVGTIGDLGWNPITEEHELQASATPAGMLPPWFGEIAVTNAIFAGRRGGEFEFRIVIEEWEQYRTDGLETGSPRPSEPGRRLVYTDVIPVARDLLS